MCSRDPSAARGALRVESLRFTYPAKRGQRRRGDLETLRGIDLEIPIGEMVAMLGPNGSGKSTLMKIICGLLPVQTGRIEMFGASDLASIRRRLGVVFQSPALDRHMTVRENLRDQASLYGLTTAQARQAIERELQSAELVERRDAIVKTLSHGLARRADLCRAMLHQPRFLMLDEATVGLDPGARQRFVSQLQDRRAADPQLTVLLSTHLVDEADRCDRVLLMHQGQLIADDTPANLRKSAGALRVTVHDAQWQPPVAEAGRWRRGRGREGWIAQLRDDGRASSAQDLAAALARNGVPFSIAPPSLADVFEQLTGAALADDNATAELEPPPERAA